MEKFINKLIASVLAAVMAISSPAVLVHADDEAAGKYVSDVFIAYGENQEEATQWLIANGWEPIKGDNDFTAGKSSMFFDNISTAMGIKRTDKAEDAITDMAVMNMKGGYSIPAYEDLIKERKTEIDEFINTFIPVLKEFRDNYNGSGSEIGRRRAELAYSVLNKFTDGSEDDLYAVETDSRLPMGELLISETKQEGNDSGADLEQIILEGSGPAVVAIEQLLTLGTDTAESTWLERLSTLSGDELSANISKYVPEAEGQDLAPSAVTALLNSHFKDGAAVLAGQWDDVHSMMDWFEKYNENNGLWQQDGESDEAYAERVNKYFEELKAKDEDKYTEDQNNYNNYGILYHGLYDVKFEGKWGETLGDLFNPADGTDYSAENDIFLPFIAALSEGQRSAINIVSFSSLLLMGFSDESGLEYAKPDVDNLFGGSDVSFSVYTGVNRAIYRGGVALTSQALMEQNMGRGQAFDAIWSPLGIAAIASYAAAAVGVTMMIAGGVMAAKGKVTRYFSWNYYDVGQAEQQIEQAKELKTLAMTHKGRRRITELQNADAMMKKAEANLNKAKGPETQVTTKMGYAGRWMLGIGGVLLVGAALVEAYSLYQYYNRTFTPIPQLIVDEADIVSYTRDAEGKEVKNVEFDEYVYYTGVKCNRQLAGKLSYWQDGVDSYQEWGCGDIADLNGDFGQEWLALYTVKSEKKGNPILADSLKLQYGSDSMPEGTTKALHLFTYTYAVDLGDTAYSYNNDKNGVYFFWDVDENAEASEAASSFSGGHMALAAAGGLIIGVLAATFALIPKRRKKEEA